MDTKSEETYEFFFFNDTATTEIYTLSLHDALPISGCDASDWQNFLSKFDHIGDRSSDLRNHGPVHRRGGDLDRKSTRLNSSHDQISYAVFCLKKKKCSYSCRQWFIGIVISRADQHR